MTARRRLLASLCLSPLMWGMAAPAFAEAAATPVADDGEILVTARRVEEKVRDVPATISVLTESAIRASGVTVATDFVQLVPGVTIVTGNVEAGDVQISVRGLNGTRDAESNVALIVDGILKTNTAALNQNAGTLSQIEVLKGPQGAIYGRNAAAGAVILSTRKPGDRLEGQATVSYAEYDHKRAAGYLSGPLGAGVGLLVSGDYEKGNGFYKNVFQGTPAFDAYKAAILSVTPGVDVPGFSRHSVDNFLRWNVNARLTADLGDRTSVDIKGKYGRVAGGTVVFGAAYAIPGLVPFVGPAAYLDVNDYDFTNAFQGNLKSRQVQITKEVSVKLTHDTDWASLQAWAAYSDIANSYTGEGTSGSNGYFFPQAQCRATTAALAGFPTPAPTFIGGTPETSFFAPYSPTTCDGYQFNKRNQTDFSAEFRIASLPGSDLSWLAGGYYLHIDRHICVNLATDTGQGAIRQCFTLDPRSRTEALSDDKFKTNVYAMFGSVQNKFSDSFTASLALRYDREERAVRNQIPTDVRTLFVNPQGNGQGGYYLNPGLDPVYNPSGVLPPRSKAFEQVEPKLSLTYKPSEQLTLFGNWGIGFKSGGFNSGGSAAIVNTFNGPPLNANITVRDDYKKEVSSAFEAGFKSALMDGRLSIEGALYYTDIKDMQFFEFYVGSFGLLRVVSNIDKARLYGGELSVSIRPVRGWTLFGSGNVTDSKIRKNSSRPDTVGNKVPYASDYTLNLGSQLDMPVSGGLRAIGRVDYRLTGPTWFHSVQAQTRPSLNGVADFSRSRRDALGIVNLRAGIATDHWSLTAFANNLTDKKWINEVVPAPELGGSFVSPGTRQQFGLELSAKF
ncbi:TonB-dependent receptor domain-containing protein [Sphingomonas sp. YL-JM2C]